MTISTDQFRKNVRVSLWGFTLGFLIIHFIVLRENPQQFHVAAAASILALGCRLGFRIIAEPVISKYFNVLFFVLLIASIFRLFLVRYWMNTDEYDLFFLLIFGSQCCCLILLTNLKVTESFAALAVLSAVFTDHIAAHPLEDFRKVVNYPKHYVSTEINDDLSSRPENGFYVLSGPTGIGKSVALLST
ncbi:hypothetical protein GEMRC1_013375 [Eukaryota sp. GEM-RC1]